MKKILPLLFLVLFCLATGRLWYWATDGFRLSRIEGYEGIGREREFSEEADMALSQRYFYLGRGRQCFAFQSEDGMYVIKFARMDRYKDCLWFCLEVFNFFKQYIGLKRESRSSRKEMLFDSFEISYDELKDDTAMVAMSPPPKNSKEIEIVDRLGRVFPISLEKTGFILQHKLALFQDVFQDALAKKDMVEAGRILDQLLELIERVAEKGILSKDGSFLKNFGFDGSRAYQIDIGSFYRAKNLSSKDAFTASIHASVETLRVWLLRIDPALLELIDRKLEPIYERGNKT
jgi:hypothetical protein